MPYDSICDDAVKATAGNVLETLPVLFHEGQVVEMRIPNYPQRSTTAGYFSDFQLLATEAARYSGRAPGVYVTLNPVTPALLARMNNRVDEHAKQTTADPDVSQRRWLLLDFDPRRPAGISASEDEHQAALARARECRAWLKGLGWPAPVCADSGNGAHLLYRIDLPNNDDSRQLVERCLKAVAFRCGDNRVDVDQTVFNAARITKLYGTLTCKGDSTPERPHRQSRLLTVPREVQAVSLELLRALAALVPNSEPAAAAGNGHAGKKFDLRDWIQRRGLKVAREGPWGNGGYRWVLAECPWDPRHADGAAFLLRFAGGAIAAGCHHNSCAGRSWHDLRDKLEPGWREHRPAGGHQQRQAVGGPKKETAADQLVRLALDSGCELWHDRDQAAYATLPELQHRANHLVGSKPFRLWLAHLFYEQTGKNPSAQAVQDALNSLAGFAVYEGQEHPVYLRVTGQEGRIYLDLGDDSRRVVEVDAEGWRILEAARAKFRRTKGLRPLPEPVAGGSLDGLRPFVNVANDDDWRLVVGWLVAAFRPGGPYPILCLAGEQGSAKSTTAKVLRSLLDPSGAPLRSPPRDERDLWIAASNGWVVSLNNLSFLPDWLSDALCRLAVDGGFSTRKLYEDDEEMIFDGRRPIIVNGIEDLARRGDLLDRALVVTLPAIPDDRRHPEDEFWREFDAAWPRLLGALLDVVAAGLRRLPDVHLDRLPRMADFAKWVTACEPALGWEAGDFLDSYGGNVADANDLALGDSPLVVPLRKFHDAQPGRKWKGTASDLLAELVKLVDDQVTARKDWPKGPNALSGKLRRLAPNLRRAGLAIDFGRPHGGRLITLSEKSWTKHRQDRHPSPINAKEPGNSATLGDDPGDDLGDDD